MSVSGLVRWPAEAPVWTFLWEMIDGDSEAIAFRDVTFRGRKVLHKASLPMIRVRYDSGHGPYKDPLSIRNKQGPVTIVEHHQGGFRHLVVESYHRIGRYHLINRWFLRSDGLILPQLHSAGLQHPSTHQHHVYWRFDFDIDGAASNLPLEFTTGESTNWGYGPGWRPMVGEEALYFVDKSWAVLNKQTNRGYLIERGPHDGQADGFSGFNGAAVVYHGYEDLKGRLGTAWDDGIYQHVTGEAVDGVDVVFWYIAHLHHHYPGSGDEWHVGGPLLVPFGF